MRYTYVGARIGERVKLAWGMSLVGGQEVDDEVDSRVRDAVKAWPTAFEKIEDDEQPVRRRRRIKQDSPQVEESGVED